MKRMLFASLLIVCCGLLQGCVTNGSSNAAEPEMDKMAASNATNTSGHGNNDYMFRSSTYQTGQTAEPYIGR